MKQSTRSLNFFSFFMLRLDDYLLVENSGSKSNF